MDLLSVLRELQYSTTDNLINGFFTKFVNAH